MITRFYQKNKALVSYWIILALCFTFVYCLVFDHKLFLGGDNAFYYILGKSIHIGNGYRNIHMYGEPLANHFPPGYPFLISIAMFVSSSFLWIKICNGLFFFSSLLLLFAIVHNITKNMNFSFLVSMVVLLNSQILRYSYIMMSEMPFMFFSLLTLLFVLKDDHQTKENGLYFYLSIITLVISYYIRSQGIALLGGVVLFFLIMKKWRKAVGVFVLFVLGILPWTLRGISLGGNIYINQLILKNPYRPELGMMQWTDLFNRIGENILRYLSKEIPRSVFPFLDISQTKDPLWYHYFIGLLIIGLVIYGIFSVTKKYRGLLIGYLSGQFLIQLLWPTVWFGVRFMLPIVPILQFLLLLSLYNIFWGRRVALENQNNTKIKVGLLGIFILFNLPSVKKLNYRRDVKWTQKYVSYFHLAKWCESNTPKDAVIACRKPALFYLYANRKVAMFKNAKENVLLKDMKKNHVSHVVIDRLGYASTTRYLVPALKSRSSEFKQVCAVGYPACFLMKWDH